MGVLSCRTGHLSPLFAFLVLYNLYQFIIWISKGKFTGPSPCRGAEGKWQGLQQKGKMSPLGSYAFSGSDSHCPDVWSLLRWYLDRASLRFYVLKGLLCLGIKPIIFHGCHNLRVRAVCVSIAINC